MSLTSKKSKETISDKFLKEYKPRELLDPENNSDDELKLAEIDSDDNDEYHYGKAGTSKLSDFRKKNIKLLSEESDKYKGKISSRKELKEEDESDYEESDSEKEEDEENDTNRKANEGSAENSNEESDLEIYRKQLKKCQINDQENDESFSTDDEIEKDVSGSENEESENSEDSDYGSSGEETNNDSGNDNMIADDNENLEIQKGFAVQNQLKIWEKLLEIRIHSQKVLMKANSLPESEIFDKISSTSPEFKSLATETNKNVENLLDQMIEMENLLTKQYSETKNLLKDSRKRRSTVDNDVEPASKRFSGIIQENYEQFIPYRNAALQKWYDRTKVLTPGAGGRKNFNSDFDILKKIEAALLNKSDFVKKSQIVKGNYQIFGQTENENNKSDEEGSVKIDNVVSSPNIYDDTDFYSEQLRELIEFKTNTSSNPTEITKQFAELQKLRQKMKKKVDTRASKGRKVRYVVHNKLINFMAPQDNSECTAESRNELINSLFK